MKSKDIIILKKILDYCKMQLNGKLSEGKMFCNMF